MQKKLIKTFYEKNQEFISSPFTYQGYLNDKGKNLFKGLDLKGKKILEVGCGHGHVLQYCKKQGGNCRGIDLSERCIRKAKKLYKDINFSIDDFENIKNKKIREEKYDIIIILEVLEHMLDYHAAIKRISFMLADGGHLILSCPNYFNSCGVLKKVFDPLLGKNKWSPFMNWRLQENEVLLTYPALQKELKKYFKIEKIETIDILRGLFPFFYINTKIEHSSPVKCIRKILERRGGIFKYFGSNIVVKAKK